MELPNEYREYLNTHISRVESVSSKFSGLDERLDYQNIILTEMLNTMSRALGGGKPDFLQQQQRILPPYNLQKILLDTATTDKEISIPGDYLAFYTDGSMSGIAFKVDDPTHDSINILEFSYYIGHFEKIYLTWTAQASKYLRVFVGRGEQYRYWG